jgi:uncharacterized protein (DUF1684 family)
MKRYSFIGFIIIGCMFFLSCGESLEQKGDQKYIKEIEEWHAKRVGNLKKENGWLNLVGLFWLKEGTNSFGSSNENDIVFPESKCPPVIGKFILNDSIVTVEINEGVEVNNAGKKVTEMILLNDLQGVPTILEHKSLRWFVIKRGEKYGIRLRDLESDLVKSFNGIERFPVNSDWKLEAEFDSYNPPKVISVPNILGTIDEEKSPGALVFEKDGSKYKLDVLDGNDSYFVIFADITSGKETYGGGRFIYVPKPDSTGKIFIDFNKAYNPPCVFTKYATCPLPPKQNHLKIRILAGEMNYGH